MPRFVKKTVVTVGRPPWAVDVPRPPKHATHARLTCLNEPYQRGKPKTATLPIDDFGCFKGVVGEFKYIRMNKQMKILEEYDGTWDWDGRKVIGIENL